MIRTARLRLRPRRVPTHQLVTMRACCVAFHGVLRRMTRGWIWRHLPAAFGPTTNISGHRDTTYDTRRGVALRGPRFHHRRAMAKLKGGACLTLPTSRSTRPTDARDGGGRLASPAMWNWCRLLRWRSSLVGAGDSRTTRPPACPHYFPPPPPQHGVSLLARPVPRSSSGEIVIGVNALDYSGYPSGRSLAR